MNGNKFLSRVLLVCGLLLAATLMVVALLIDDDTSQLSLLTWWSGTFVPVLTIYAGKRAIENTSLNRNNK